MELKNYIYLLLLVVFMAISMALSLRKPLRFQSRLKYFFPPVLFTGAIFIIWNLRFTELGIFYYNPDYLSGKQILNLPVEEWLFLLVISYIGIFSYEGIRIYMPRFDRPNLFLGISLVVLLISGILTYVFRDRLFAFFTFFLLTIYFGYTIFRNRFKPYYTRFYLSYLITLVPFMLLKGILMALPATGYDPVHIIGIRIFKLPIENLGYLFLLMLINVTIYEYLKSRRIY